MARSPQSSLLNFPCVTVHEHVVHVYVLVPCATVLRGGGGSRGGGERGTRGAPSPYQNVPSP